MGPGVPRAAASDMALCGVYFAIVTQNQDSEGLCRIKVRFPWLPGGDSDQAHWAQLAVPMIGGEFGTLTLPEVGDTVAVVFVGGDIRQPVVMGGVWSKEDEPPDTNEDGKNDYRFIKSRAGARLLFDDSSNAKVVLTDHKDEQYLGVGKLGAGSGPSALEVSVPQGGGTSGVGAVSVGGGINLWCPNGKLTITAKMDCKITASDKLDIKSGGDMTIKGALGTASASGNAKLEGSKVKIN